MKRFFKILESKMRKDEKSYSLIFKMKPFYKYSVPKTQIVEFIERHSISEKLSVLPQKLFISRVPVHK